MTRFLFNPAIFIFLFVGIISSPLKADYLEFKQVAKCMVMTKASATPLAVSPKGDKIVAGLFLGEESHVILFKLQDKDCVQIASVVMEGKIGQIIFSPNHLLVVFSLITDREIKIVVLSSKDFSPVATLLGHKGKWLHSMSFLEGKKKWLPERGLVLEYDELVSVDSTGQVIRWDLAKRFSGQTLLIRTPIDKAVFSMNGRTLLTVAMDKKEITFRTWDVRTEDSLALSVSEVKVEPSVDIDDFLSTLSFSLDKGRFVVQRAGFSLMVLNHLFDIEFGLKTDAYTTHAAFSPTENNILAYLSDFNRLEIVEFEYGGTIKVHQRLPLLVDKPGSQIAFSADGDTIAVGQSGGVIQVFSRN